MNHETKISPILLLIIILVAAIIFIAGIAHLLLRYLIKTPLNTISPPMSQSQTSQSLHRLFRLSDTSGLDQLAIDALPLFSYKHIIAGPTQPFECAVCLSQFSGNDHLRLLPACSHAFHAGCIDVWLLSSSTCPLCRRVVLVDDVFGHGAETGDGDGDGVLAIRLGNFERSERERELDERRCYSMGTVRYVVNEGELMVRLRGEVVGRRGKGESFSVSKIWLWSKNGRFASCSDTDICLPTSEGNLEGGGIRELSLQMV